MSRLVGCVCFLLLVMSGVVAAAEGEWQSVLPAVNPSEAVAGRWVKRGEELQVTAADGARVAIPVMMAGEYDFRIQFTRVTGQHSIAMFFMHGGKLGAFEVDAWGQHLAGIQMIGGRDVRQNPTKKEGVTLKNGQHYTMVVEVRKDRVRGLLDDQEIASYQTNGNDLSLPAAWQMPNANQLGIGAWNAETVFHSIEVRSLSGTPVTLAPSNTGVASSSRPPMTTPAAQPAGNGKKVLIVIANQDFFYREYSEPREELEKAGFQVVVGAGRKGQCRPHNGSGQGQESGVVMAEVSLAEVKASDYEAILFSGGWGASMYQFAFEGRYNSELYNGDRRTKTEVNRVIGEFVAADKYVCGLCNAVTVLAWSRVDGKSLLQGKRVCAPTREAPPGIYNGRQAQPSCRWAPEQNGAILSPSGAVGDRNSVRDDVLVDGKVITGEDDSSAREMGRVMVRVLTTAAR